MGSSSKKYKEKESRKRRHQEEYDHDAPREKKHKHKKHHHKEKRKDKSKYYDDYEKYSKHAEKSTKQADYQSDDSDVIEVIPDSPPDTPTSKSNGKTPEKPSETYGQSVESLSIDETNKLRAKLGLRPLDVGSSTSSSTDTSKGNNEKKKDDLGEFYHKPAENLHEKAQQEKIRAKLSEIKEKRMLTGKLAKVKTLGESDSEDDSVSWVYKSRKIEHAKKEAERRAKELEELDAQFGIGEVVESDRREKMRQKYTDKDLRGLTVQHDLSNFAEEQTMILTLKDTEILKDGEDVLVNVNMLDDERYKKNIDNKKKTIRYNPYDDMEYDEFGNYMEKSLLSKYDEEIDGEKRESFKIGYSSFMEKKQAAVESVKAKLAKKRLESLTDKSLTIASEYYNDEELAKFKKPKKKVRKIRSKGKLLTADELKPDNAGIEKIGSRRPKVKNDDDYDIDDVPAVNVTLEDIKIEEEKDDLLEKALHKSRKIKQKENIIAEIVKTEIKEEPEEENIDSGNIILNSTAEFCRTLGDIPTYGKSGNRDETEEIIDFDKDIIPEENSDDDCEIVEQQTGWNFVNPTNQGIDSTQIVAPQSQILDEEPDVSTGVGAALKLAMSKGYLDKEQTNRPSNTRLAHLQAQHYSIEDKSYGEDDRGNRRERYAGPVMDFREKETFKPNVKLEYIDDDGRVLNSKEAFRYLSHKFHGKGPGKNKVEKRIKKQNQEQLMKKMSSTDTPLGTLNMLQQKQKETQSPFIVLSGNKQQQSTSLSKSRR